MEAREESERGEEDDAEKERLAEKQKERQHKVVAKDKNQMDNVILPLPLKEYVVDKSVISPPDGVVNSPTYAA